jgi:hypothetical protein
VTSQVPVILGNVPPTDIALSSNSIAEGADIGTQISVLSTTDANSGDTFAYSLVDGIGSQDNGAFRIVGNTLRSDEEFDFETKSSYSIRIRSTDQDGLFTEKTFTISVTDANRAPTDISLSSTSIAENAGANATVGTLSTTDPDSGNTFTYSLVAGTGDTDNAAFNISGALLRATNSFNFETKSSYSIRIRSTDQDGLFTEKTFTISVTDVPEVPYQNPTNPYDVDNDRSVSPLDVLTIINLINSIGASIPFDQLPESTPFVNVNGDNQIDPLDVLALINFINSRNSGGEGEAFTHFVGVLIPDNGTESMVSAPSSPYLQRPDRCYPDTAFTLLESREGSYDLAQGVLESIIEVDVEEWIPPSEEEKGMRLISRDDFFADLGRE